MEYKIRYDKKTNKVILDCFDIELKDCLEAMDIIEFIANVDIRRRQN